MLKKPSERSSAMALFLVLIGMTYRILPHPENFVPISAIAIFAAATLPRAAAFTVPVAAMIASDLVIGPHDLFWLTWAAFALTGVLGVWVSKAMSVTRIAAASLAGSTFFFIVTNLGVFVFESLYPKTWAGLVDCFVKALPFYRNTIWGDLFFSAVFFGAYALAGKRAARPLRVSS
jgi:hypothetical protein